MLFHFMVERAVLLFLDEERRDRDCLISSAVCREFARGKIPTAIVAFSSSGDACSHGELFSSQSQRIGDHRSLSTGWFAPVSIDSSTLECPSSTRPSTGSFLRGEPATVPALGLDRGKCRFLFHPHQDGVLSSARAREVTDSACTKRQPLAPTQPFDGP